MNNNKITGLILCAIFISGFSATVLGQKKQIGVSEFYNAHSKAVQKKYELSRREETTSETFSETGGAKSTSSVFEMLMPNKSRYVYREKIGDVSKETEAITIDNFRYTRENGGAWTKIDLSKEVGSGSGRGSGSASGSFNSCRQTTVEPAFFSNYSAQLYEDLFITSGEKGLTYSETKHWISDEGLVLKSERSEGTFIPKVETSKTVMTIEYNPNIKIEAPIK